MQSNNKRVILILVGVFVLVTAGIFLFVNNTIGQMKKEQKTTLTLNEEVRKYITDYRNFSEHIQIDPDEELEHDLHYEDEKHLHDVITDWQDKPDFRNFLFLEHSSFKGDADEYYYYRYHSDINKALGMEANTAADAQIDGIILCNSQHLHVGDYEGSGQGFRPFYILTYISFPQKEFVYQELIWGGMPPAYIDANQQAGIGKLPKEKQIIEIVKQTLSL